MTLKGGQLLLQTRNEVCLQIIFVFEVLDQLLFSLKLCVEGSDFLLTALNVDIVLMDLSVQSLLGISKVLDLQKTPRIKSLHMIQLSFLTHFFRIQMHQPAH